MKGFTFGSLVFYYLTGLSLAQRCFQEKCSVDGVPGCKLRMRGKFNSANDCCKSGSALGYYDIMTRVGNTPGCFKCDSCVDILSKRDGKWGRWSSWSACSKSCGNGFRSRSRRCDSPSPSKLGKVCAGKAVERIVCNEQTCPIDGQWSEWSDWSDCSETCGQGTSFRTRQCSNPAPAFGGRECQGSKRQTKVCLLVEKCPIHGGWSDWSLWSECSNPCGVGESKQTRLCNNPYPRYGGNLCEGKSSRSVYCNEHPCPIDGKWSEWSEQSPCIFSNCSDPTKGGHRTRSRSCTNPAPQYGGKMCAGKFFHLTFCVESDNCHSDGEWTEWEHWKCSNTGALRIRYCVFSSKFRGKDCEGIGKENKHINDRMFCEICPSECRLYKGAMVAKILIPKPDKTVSDGGSGDDGSGSGFGDDDEDGDSGSGYLILKKI